MHKCTNHLVDFLKQMTFCKAACSQPSQQISIYLQGITEQRFLAVLGWLHHVTSIYIQVNLHTHVIIHIHIIYWISAFFIGQRFFVDPFDFTRKSGRAQRALLRMVIGSSFKWFPRRRRICRRSSRPGGSSRSISSGMVHDGPTRQSTPIELGRCMTACRYLLDPFRSYR